MMNFTLTLAFLFTFSWITKSDFEFYSVVVQPGEDVTLLCSNLSSFTGHIFWFKLIDGPNVSRISSIKDSKHEARLHDGFQYDKFNMTSNGTNIFLSIKQVNFSDSGIYICGLNSDKCCKIFSEAYLQVKDGLDGFNTLPTVILGSVVIALAMVVLGLVLKIKSYHTAQSNRQDQQHNENLDTDALNYAALNFRPKTKSNRRPVAEREMDPNVLYAATR